MDSSEILGLRLSNHHISSDAGLGPDEVVSKLGSMQAQDYFSALWAIGLRSREGTCIQDVEKAVEDRWIVRTWLNRGTVHFSNASDTKWMLDLFSAGLSKIASKRDTNLGLTEGLIKEVERVFVEALGFHEILTRQQMYDVMETTGVATRQVNLGYHMLYRAAWDGLICFGPQKDRKQTFVRMDKWLPETEKPGREEALAEIALRYFSSHGPATLHDFAWWSGLKISESRKAIELNSRTLSMEETDSSEYFWLNKTANAFDNDRADLLPAFDEYLVGYSDRSAIFDGTSKEKVIHQNGTFRPVILLGGKVAGTWTAKKSGPAILVKTNLFVDVDSKEKDDIKETVQRYGDFLQSDVSIRL